MSAYDAISVENVSCEDVRGVLLSQLGINVQEDRSCFVMGLTIDVQDVSEEMKYGIDFLQSQGLQEEHLFYREFDMRSFNVVVELQSRYECKDIRPAICDEIGKLLSMKLKTRVVIAFDNGEIPFCIYNNGIKTHDLKEYYKSYFAEKLWQPIELICDKRI